MQKIDDKRSNAINEVKERFYRMPSNGNPQFIDIESGVKQGDTFFLLDYYKQFDDSESDVSGEILLNSLNVCFSETFKPNDKKYLSGKKINVWTPPDLQPSGNKGSEEEVPLFIEFLERWFPIESEREYFLWWIAHSVRKPENRILATPLLRSEHGVGKGFLVETLLSSLIGFKSIAVANVSDVTGDFNDVLEGKTLVFLDEVYSCSAKSLNTLKSLQGNKFIPLKRKFKAIINIENYINFIMASNQKRPFTIEHGDRRLWVPQFITHEVNSIDTSNFINHKLKKWLLKESGLQLVRDYIESIDLNAFSANSSPPETDSKVSLMSGVGVDLISRIVQEEISEKEVVSASQIAIKNQVQLNSASEACVAKALRSLGCVNKRLNDKRVWITPTGFSMGITTKSTPKHLKQLLASH